MKTEQSARIARTNYYLGIFLLAFIFALELVFFQTISLEKFIVEKLFASFLLYSSALLKLETIEKHPIKKSLSHIKQSRNYIYAVIGLFLLSTIIGVVFNQQLSFLDETLRELLEKTINLSPIELISFILLNNSLASILGVVSGIILGIFPITSSISNGVVLGYVLSKVGILEFWRLLPHGIFELPAVFISFGLGIKLGSFIFAKNKIKTLKQNLGLSIIAIVYIIIPLLIIAAIIEGALIFLLP